MGCQLRAPEPSVTLVNSVTLGTFQVQKSKIAQKDGSEVIRCWLAGLSPRAMRRRRASASKFKISLRRKKKDGLTTPHSTALHDQAIDSHLNWDPNCAVCVWLR